MKLEQVVLLPKSFKQRYATALIVLCAGIGLSFYSQRIELRIHEKQWANEIRKFEFFHLNHLSYQFSQLEQDIHKLEQLLQLNFLEDEAKQAKILETFNKNIFITFKLQNISEEKESRPASKQAYRLVVKDEYLSISKIIQFSQSNSKKELLVRVSLKELVNDFHPGIITPVIDDTIVIVSPENDIKNSENAKKSRFQFSKEIVLLGQSLSLYATPDRYETLPHAIYSSLFVKLLASLIITAIAYNLDRREQKIRDIVRYRTKELAAANASLAKEITEHRNAIRQIQETELQLRAITDILPMAVLQFDHDLICQFFNKTALEWLGESHCLIHGKAIQQKYAWLKGFDEQSTTIVISLLEEALQTQTILTLETQLLFKNKVERWIKIQVLPKTDSQAKGVGFYLIMSDISQQVMAEQSIKRSNQNHIILSELGKLALSSDHLNGVYEAGVFKLAESIEHSLVYLARLTPNKDNYFDVEAASNVELTQYSAPLPAGASVQKILFSDNEDLYVIKDVPLIMPNGDGEVVKSIFVPIMVFKKCYGFIAVQQKTNKNFEHYEIYLIQGTAHLISQAIERYQTKSTLFNEKERAEVTLASITDAVITTDQEGNIEFINFSAEKMLGWTRQEVIGQSIQRVMRISSEGSREYIKNPLNESLDSGEVVIGEGQLVLFNRYGHERAIDCSAAPLHGSNGDILGGVLVFRDVTSQRQLSHQLSHQATHDALTGLINRFEFERRLSHILTNASVNATVEECASENALLYMDLDQFKVVNDTCGHAAGDALLRQLSGVLLQRLRKRDTLARLGGDEFAVLLEHCPPNQAERIAHELRQTVRDFRFSWDNKVFRVGVSIGLISFQHAASLGQLLSAADTACYLAKESGRDRIQVSRMDDTPLSEAHQQMNWVLRLQHALDENRFQLYAQEIRALHDPENKQPKHYEILIRLLDESQNIILPGAFIPAAERYNLMTQIDKWVIEASFLWLSSYAKQADSENIILGLNLSGRSLGDETLLTMIRDMIKDFGIDPGHLCFEITETAAITNMHVASRLILGLREIGCHFALDDFGSGMSSFGYLKNLPVDYLKIDGNFVKDILQDPIDWVMVESISKVGQAMGLHVIAEYAESEVIIDRLRELGVDYAQGYGIGKPIPLNDIIWPIKLIS